MAVAVLALLAGCGGDGGGEERAAAVPARATTTPAVMATTTTAVPVTTPAAPPPTTTTSAPPPPTTSAPPRPTTTRPPTPVVVVVPYRVEVRTADPAAASFPAVVEATLSDPRGWVRAGFVLERRDDAPYLIVIAEGPEVDALCLPHDTYGEYSCQRENVVAINAERWREATPKWTGDLPTYRRMVVNHEVGHLLGQPHPKPQCPAPGKPAPVMAQQSTELDGCLPNPWPLPDEIERAARHDRPLAPL